MPNYIDPIVDKFKSQQAPDTPKNQNMAKDKDWSVTGLAKSIAKTLIEYSPPYIIPR